MTYEPIIGTLGYIVSSDRRSTLLIRRDARKEDFHYSKYNGLGGKMRANEDVLGCLKREIKEEAGVECVEIILRGVINWPNFGPDGQDWLGFVFRIDAFEGVPLERNPEGTLCWHPIEHLGDLPMWEGDRYFLQMVFDDDPRVFYGHMPYEEGRPVSWTCHRI